MDTHYQSIQLSSSTQIRPRFHLAKVTTITLVVILLVSIALNALHYDRIHNRLQFLFSCRVRSNSDGAHPLRVDHVAAPVAMCTCSPSPIAGPYSTPVPEERAATLSPSSCEATDCFNVEGPGDYIVIGNSMSNSEDRSDCSLQPSTSASLDLPESATVHKAILYWSASGATKDSAHCELNGTPIHASKTFRYSEVNAYTSLHFYGGYADVTDVVTGSAEFSVSGIRSENNGWYCFRNSVYAAWSMVVIYAKPGLPAARIDACFDDFKFTFPAGVYKFQVGCVHPAPNSTGKTTVVAFEGDKYKIENFYIAGVFISNDAFHGSTAPNLDILTFSISEFLAHVTDILSYTLRSYYQRTIFGGAIEGLFLPVRVVYYTL